MKDIMIERINKLIVEKNCSLDEVADGSGIKRVTMKRYMNGDIGKMKTTEISNVAKYLDVHPAYLMDWMNYRELKYTVNGEVFIYKNKSRESADKMVLEELIGKGILKVEEIDW